MGAKGVWDTRNEGRGQERRGDGKIGKKVGEYTGRREGEGRV